MVSKREEKNNSSLFWQELNNPRYCRALASRLQGLVQGDIRFMEVCGTHTHTIFQSGLKSLFPQGLQHVSGPGCPVCVTHADDIAAFVELARTPGVTVATFGDMLRVPGPDGLSLQDAQAEGASIKICYSPFDAVHFAQENPSREVVFLGVGFETTAPAVAATMHTAGERGLSNLSLYSCHKLIPPALDALLRSPGFAIDGFLLPGHVSTVIGLSPYSFLPREQGDPCVIAGFEPADVLQALLMLVKRINQEEPDVDNQYSRAVAPEGNSRAQEMMSKVFARAEAQWRGLGIIPSSGLELRQEYAHMDAKQRFSLSLRNRGEPAGCRCGEVLQGAILPRDCSLFAASCTPASPVGPCMVSSEGSCAAWYKYGLE